MAVNTKPVHPIVTGVPKQPLRTARTSIHNKIQTQGILTSALNMLPTLLKIKLLKIKLSFFTNNEVKVSTYKHIRHYLKTTKELTVIHISASILPSLF